MKTIEIRRKPFLFNVLLILAFAIIASLTSCNKKEPPVDHFPEQSGVIIPTAGAGIALFAQVDQESEISDGQSPSLPKVNIPEQYIAHAVYDLNLDSDTQDEQIIAFKYRDGQDDRIGILVADYDLTRATYFVSWTGLTSATSLKTFSLYTQDVTGDREQEIVVLGTNGIGEQTMDIFKQHISNNYGLQFRNIIAIEADMEASIAAVERSEYYNNGERSGVAYTIAAVNQDLESDNPLDMIRSVYTWRSGEQRYLLSYTEDIPGSRIEEDQLAELYSGNLDDYIRFIAGPWVRQDEIGDDQILYFSPQGDEVQLAFPDSQTNFETINYQMVSLGRTIVLDLQNENLAHIKPRIIVSVLDLNTLSIRMNRPGILESSDYRYNEIWSGTFSRMLPRGSLDAVSILDDIDYKSLYPYSINGLFLSDNNLELFFSAPYVTLRTPEGERSGGYVVYRINDQVVLEMSFFNSRSLAPEKQQYVLTYEEAQEDGELQRQIFLQPAELNTFGALVEDDEVLRFVQTIETEDSTDS